MELFHGTNTTSAANIIGPPNNIDVNLGRGELGLGFYAGVEPSMSAALARGRYKDNPAVLEINIDNGNLIALNVQIIKRGALVRKHWAMLINSAQTKTFKFGVDYVIAPFATFELSHQYKFESRLAQDILNNSIIKKIL